GRGQAELREDEAGRPQQHEQGRDADGKGGLAQTGAACGGRIHACLAWMMLRRIARVRVNLSNSVAPSPLRIARCITERSSLKRPSISSTASLLVRNTSRHIVGSEAAMRVKSRKPPAANLITSPLMSDSRSTAV